MSKITAGYLIVGGLLCAPLCAGFAIQAANGSESPSTDLAYDILKYFWIAGTLVSVGVFAYAASKFTNAK